MQIRFAALGGTEVDAQLLDDGIVAIGQRPDFEEIAPMSLNNTTGGPNSAASPFSNPGPPVSAGSGGGGASPRSGVVPAPPSSHRTPSSIRLYPPWTGDHSSWSVAEIAGEDGITTLVEVARTIAAHTKKNVRAMASGVEGPAGIGRVEVSYRAFEITPDGMSNVLSFDEADELCGEADEDSLDELGDMLSILVGDSAVHAMRPANIGRCYRRKPLLDDPRLARLAASILAAKSVAFTADGADRVRVSLEGIDGAKQISLVTDDEANQLRRVTAR